MVDLDFMGARRLMLNSSIQAANKSLTIFSIAKMAAWRSQHAMLIGQYQVFKGAFVWDQSGIRIIGIKRVSVCLGAVLIPEYLDFHSGYSTPRSRIAGIHFGIYSGINSYSGISQTNAP